jgi:hypothetical protein
MEGPQSNRLAAFGSHSCPTQSRAAAVMGVNNIFYRFRHLSSNKKYTTMAARLRMLNEETVLAAVRIASVIHALAAVFDAEPAAGAAIA